MSDACGSSSIFSRIAYSVASTGSFANFTSADVAWPLADGGCSLALKQDNINNSGSSGFTAQASELSRPGLKMVDGDFNMLATPLALTTLLPHVTGRAIASNVTYPIEDLPPKFHIMAHRDSSIYVYTDLYANKFTIGSDAGGPVKMVVGCIGRDREETPTAGTSWTSGLNIINQAPYMHQDCVITVGGTTYKFKTWQLEIDNKLAPQYFDSVTACGMQRQEFAMTTLKLSGPHTQTTVTSLMQGAIAPAALNVVITMTHPTGAQSCIIRCQALQIPVQDPPSGKGTILLELNGVARRVDGGASGGAEVIFTNDSVP